MRFGILGPLAISDGGSIIDVGSKKQRALLALLLINANTVVSRDRIIDALWPDDPPTNPAAALRFHVSKLRDQLHRDTDLAPRDAIIVTRRPGYVITVGPENLDAVEFEHLVADARGAGSGDPTRSLSLMNQALALWRGPFLADLEYENFAREPALRYHEMRIALTEDTLAVRIDIGEEEHVIGDLEALTTKHPFRERLACLLMLALFRRGRQAEALRACQRLRRHLVEELGIDPSEPTRELEQRILDQDPSLLEHAPGPLGGSLNRRVRDFEIEGRIGEGRFGVVYRARQVSVGRDVALKSIRPEYASNPEFLRRFEAEAQLVARLEHPHIVPLYDFWREPEGAYLVLRLLRGGSLQEALRVGRWRPAEVVRLIEQVSAAAHAAHRQGVIHRDIKPANILLDEEGNGYLADFGIAKFLDAAHTLTRTGNAPVTPAYVAPELLEGSQSPSPRSDVYALAIVAHEALTGRHPYGTGSMSSMIKHQLHDPLPPIEALASASAVLHRAAAKDPSERFGDIREFARELANALVDDPSPEARVTDPYSAEAEAEAEAEADDGLTLSDFVNEAAPFGPIAMDEISARTIYRDLYDSDNRIYQEIMQRRPSFIVGRRGAGKTALMRVPLLDPSSLLVEFKSAEVFAQVLASVDALEQRGGRIFVDQIADLWEGVVWTGLCLATLQGVGDADVAQDKLRIVQRYVAGLGDAATLTVDAIASEHCRRIARSATVRGIAVFGLESTSGGVDLAEARQACLALLERAQVHPIVLIDTMEDLHLEIHTLARVLAGLFALIGRTDRAPRRAIHFRFCYPSELWNKLSDFAANPLKDAENHIKLFWHARELIKIAGHRLSLYLGLYHDSVLEDLFGRRGYDAKSLDHARIVLNQVLPAKVVNTLGGEEDALAYCLRHTQLLPRHLLRILNGIMRRRSEDDESALRVAPEGVIEGVQRVEELLVTEIFTAYSAVHANAREVCRRVIPELERAFTDGQLHRVFNQTGIRKATGLEYFDFREMLLEIGCLGRVLRYTDRYVIGEFDYTLPTPLYPGSEDDLCLHPLFSGVFRARADAADPRPVYPYGTDPDHQITW